MLKRVHFTSGWLILTWHKNGCQLGPEKKGPEKVWPGAESTGFPSQIDLCTLLSLSELQFSQPCNNSNNNNTQLLHELNEMSSIE